MNEISDTATTADDATLPAGRPRTTSDLASAKLRTALQERSGYVVVTATSAAAADALFTAVEPRLTTFRTVRASGRALDPEAIVRSLWRDGEPPFPARIAMRTLLDEARAAAQPIVVAITDAEQTDSARLERVRLTLEAAPDAGEIVRIALLGGPALVELLRRPESRAVALRIGASVQVPAVAAEIGAPVVLPSEEPRRIGAVAAFGVVIAALAGLTVWFLQPEPAPSPHAPVMVAHEAAPPPVPAPAVTAPAHAPVATPSGARLVDDPTPVGVVDPIVVAPEPEPPKAEPATPPARAPEPAPEPTAATPAATAAEPVDAAPPRPGEALQVGAFVRAEGAEALRAKLAPQFPHVYVSSAARGTTMFHRVRVNGFRSAHDVTVAEGSLRAAGYPATRVRE